MSHSVTYTPGNPTRNRIKISCVHSEHKPSTGPEHIYRIIRSESESEELRTMSQNIQISFSYVMTCTWHFALYMVIYGALALKRWPPYNHK